MRRSAFAHPYESIGAVSNFGTAGTTARRKEDYASVGFEMPRRNSSKLQCETNCFDAYQYRLQMIEQPGRKALDKCGGLFRSRRKCSIDFPDDASNPFRLFLVDNYAIDGVDAHESYPH